MENIPPSHAIVRTAKELKEAIKNGCQEIYLFGPSDFLIDEPVTIPSNVTIHWSSWGEEEINDRA